MNPLYILILTLAAWTLLNSLHTISNVFIWIHWKDVMYNTEEIKHLLIRTNMGTQELPKEEFRNFFAEPARPGDVTFHIPSILKGWGDDG